ARRPRTRRHGRHVLTAFGGRQGSVSDPRVRRRQLSVEAPQRCGAFLFHPRGTEKDNFVITTPLHDYHLERSSRKSPTGHIQPLLLQDVLGSTPTAMTHGCSSPRPLRMSFTRCAPAHPAPGKAFHPALP